MTCRLFEYPDNDGRMHRGIACSRGKAPPCPFPAQPGPDRPDPSDGATPAAFRPGAPFRSARHGLGTVVGRVFVEELGRPTRIAVRFAGGKVVEYDLATVCASAGRFSPDPGAPFG